MSAELIRAFRFSLKRFWRFLAQHEGWKQKGCAWNSFRQDERTLECRLLLEGRAQSRSILVALQHIIVTKSYFRFSFSIIHTIITGCSLCPSKCSIPFLTLQVNFKSEEIRGYEVGVAVSGRGILPVGNGFMSL